MESTRPTRSKADAPTATATASTAGATEASLNSRGERERAWQHPRLRIERLIRSIIENALGQRCTATVKATLKHVFEKRKKIRLAGWRN